MLSMRLYHPRRWNWQRDQNRKVPYDVIGQGECQLELPQWQSARSSPHLGVSIAHCLDIDARRSLDGGAGAEIPIRSRLSHRTGGVQT